MKEYNLAAEFNLDVDNLLEGRAQSSEIKAQEYGELVELSRRMIETDFSENSTMKNRLRTRLLESLRNENLTHTYREVIMKGLFKRYSPAMGLGIVALAAVLGFTMIFPGTVQGLTNNIIKVLNLGSHSSVIQIDNTAPQNSAPDKSLTPEERERLIKDGYLEKEIPGAGTVRLSAKSDVNNGDAKRNSIQYNSLEEAKKAVNFKVLTPAYLPAGYAFKAAETYRDSREYLNLTYQNRETAIIFMQRVLNSNTAFTMATNASVESLQINDVSGAWVEPNSVLWEKDGISYALFCKGLNKEEAVKIANSVK